MAEQQQLALLNFNRNGGKIEWICGCALCRVLALPIFRRFTGTDREGDNEVSEEVSPTVTQQPISSSVGVEGSGQRSVDVDAIVSRVVEEVDRRVSSRIDGVERELEGVKSSFSGVAEELRNAIIEVRSAVSELANPFNFMRKYAEIVDDSGKLLQLLGQQNTQSTSSQQVSPNLLAPLASQLPLSDDVRMLLSSILAQQRASPRQPSPFARILRLIKWVDEHLTGIPREIIDELTAFAVASGLIGEKERGLLISAISFVENMRKRGIRIREQLIMLYTVVKMLGIEDREADGEILKMIIEEGRYSQPGGVRDGL